MTHKEILKMYMGKRVDTDGSYGYQCVDWIRFYSVLREREIPNRGDAIILGTK